MRLQIGSFFIWSSIYSSSILLVGALVHYVLNLANAPISIKACLWSQLEEDVLPVLLKHLSQETINFV